VIRGLVRGSFKETLLAARQVFDEDSLGGVAIDPNVFRAFNIQAVPTFIAASAPVQPCGKGLDCVPVAPPHDALSCNISLGEALRLLEANGAAGAPAAQSASERLGG
jgi:conjugal transfer pilus assembly protein TrbC